MRQGATDCAKVLTLQLVHLDMLVPTLHFKSEDQSFEVRLVRMSFFFAVYLFNSLSTYTNLLAEVMLLVDQ